MRQVQHYLGSADGKTSGRTPETHIVATSQVQNRAELKGGDMCYRLEMTYKEQGSSPARRIMGVPEMGWPLFC